MSRDTPLTHEKKAPLNPANGLGHLALPMPVLLAKLKLQPGEYLFIAVDPLSWRNAPEIEKLLKIVMGEDYRRVIIYQRGQLDLTVASLGAE